MWKLGNASLNNEGVKEEMTQKIRMLVLSRSVVSESLRLHELQPVSHHLPGFVQVHVHCMGDTIHLSHPLMPSSPANVGNLISGSTAFSKTRLNIRKFTVHILLKLGLENFEHYFNSMWDDCNCAVVGAFLTFSSPVATAEFSKFAGIWSAGLSQHHVSGFEIAQLVHV